MEAYRSPMNSFIHAFLSHFSISKLDFLGLSAHLLSSQAFSLSKKTFTLNNMEKRVVVVQGPLHSVDTGRGSLRKTTEMQTPLTRLLTRPTHSINLAPFFLQNH